MARFSRLACALLLTAAASTSTFAAGSGKAAPAKADAPSATAAAGAPAQPGPEEVAALRSLDKRMKTIVDSMEGVGTPLSAEVFTPDFAKQASPEQVQQGLKQLRGMVGSCKLAARAQPVAANAAAYLLDCEKGFVPVELEVEEKAPNRIQSLLLRGSFWRP